VVEQGGGRIQYGQARVRQTKVEQDGGRIGRGGARVRQGKSKSVGK